MIIKYETRDGSGKDIIKDVVIKEFPTVNVNFECPICHKPQKIGCKTKNVVSSKFTDWAYVGEYVCEDCTRLFSLYFYNYIVSPSGINIVNVRQLRDQLCKPQQVPFKFCISTTQKKHLFYRATENYSQEQFAVNLETETIFTTCERMKQLFQFVENMITLGQSKEQMKQGEIRFDIIQKIGFKALKWLQQELSTSREIQIPLYCGQKLNITEEQALWNLDLILKV